MHRPSPRSAHAIALPAPAPRLIGALFLGGVLALGGALAARAQDDTVGQEGAEQEATGQGDEAVTVAHGYSDFDELKYPEGFERWSYVNPDAPKGGEISIWAQGTFDSFNPFTPKGNPASLSSIPFERIMESAADDAYGDYCLLCESLEYPESLDWVIFNLRPDVTFSDGTPMTAEDVVFTVDTFLEQGFSSYRIGVSQLYESVEALDEHRVKFTFKEDAPRKGAISQAGATIVFSKKWFTENEARIDESRLDLGPGTGPYMIDSYDINQNIVYRRNPDYWGNDLPNSVGRYNFDTIRVEYFGDASAAFEGFKAGAYTFRIENSSLQWATAYDFPALQNGYVVREDLPDGNVPAAAGFAFNLRRETFQDPRVREALGLMYNFEWTNETLQYGLFEQRDSFWQNSDLAASGKPEGLELEMLERVRDKIDPALFEEDPVDAPRSGARQLDRGNLRKAGALLDEAGWEVGSDGLRRKDGRTLKVELLEDQPQFDRIFQPYVQNLKALGIDATYNRVDPAQFQNRVMGADFDVVYDSYSTGLAEGRSLTQKFSTVKGDDPAFNISGYQNDAVDQLADVVTRAETLDEMQAGVRAIDRILRRDRFVAPSYFKANYWVAYYDMFRHPETLPPYDPGYLDFWWYDEDAAARLRSAGALN